MNGVTNGIAMRIFFSCIILACFSIQSLAQITVPTINKDQAEKVIQTAMDQQGLFWQHFTMPYRIERYEQDKDAELLELLHKRRIVDRASEMSVLKVKGKNGQPERKKITAIYEYRYKEGKEGTGIYYGSGKIRDVITISKPYLIGDFYYAEAYIRWYVSNIPQWVEHQAAQNFRLFRRVIESDYKPFEKRVYLQFDGESWSVWNARPKLLN